MLSVSSAAGNFGRGRLRHRLGPLLWPFLARRDETVCTKVAFLRNFESPTTFTQHFLSSLATDNFKELRTTTPTTPPHNATPLGKRRIMERMECATILGCGVLFFPPSLPPPHTRTHTHAHTANSIIRLHVVSASLIPVQSLYFVSCVGVLCQNPEAFHARPFNFNRNLCHEP